MNARQFYDKVVAMRDAQRRYFETRDKETLAEAKRLEKEIDTEIARVTLLLKAKDALGKHNLV